MKKTKFVLSIISVCFAIAIMAFGVFAATQVTYTVTGKVSYTVTDAYVKITTKVYKFGGTTGVTTEKTDEANVAALGAIADIFKVTDGQEGQLEATVKQIDGKDTTNVTLTNYTEIVHGDNPVYNGYYYNTLVTAETDPYDMSQIAQAERKVYELIQNLRTDLGEFALTSSDAKAVVVVVNVENLGQNNLSVAWGDLLFLNGDDENVDANWTTAAPANLVTYKKANQTLDGKGTANAHTNVNMVLAFTMKDVKASVTAKDFKCNLTIANAQ